MNTFRLLISFTATVTLGSVMRRDAAFSISSFNSSGLRPRGTNIADERQRDHAVGTNGDITAHLLIAPEVNAKHVFGTDDEPLGHRGVRRHDRGIRRGTILRMDRARQGNHNETRRRYQ